jgi:hypothetical protein
VATSVEYVGWGSGPWSRGSYGLDLTIVSVDGSEAVGAVGTVAINGVEFALTGVSATGDVGNVTIAITTDVAVSGVEGTAEVGDVSVDTSSVAFTVTGVQAQGFVGSPFLWGEVSDNQGASWQNVTDSNSPLWVPVVDAQNAQWQEVAA